MVNNLFIVFLFSYYSHCYSYVVLVVVCLFVCLFVCCCFFGGGELTFKMPNGVDVQRKITTESANEDLKAKMLFAIKTPDS